MKKQVCMVAMLLLVLSIAACMLIVAVKENPKCSVEFLVLDEDKMAKGWRNDLGFLPPALPALGAQEAYRTIMVNDDGRTIGHTVYRYRNRWLATFHFWFDRAVFFPFVSTEWSELEAADNLPLHADQQQIQCGVAHDPPLSDRCAAVLRYGPYISDFGAPTSGEGAISLEEFEEIMLKIDERFTSCVE